MMSISGNAVKLYVFIDTFTHQSYKPRLVIINRFKQVYDLRKEFAENQYYLSEEQFWIFNNTWYPDDTELSDIIEEVTPFRKGYMTYLFIMKQEEKSKIKGFVEIYLEKHYSTVAPEDRWQEPDGNPIIVTDSVDTKKPLPVIGWTCEACTTVNKHYKECCDVCFSNRPADYVIPKQVILSEEDKKQIDEMNEEKKRERELEEARLKQLEKERKSYREKLEKISKEPITYSTEDCECPICGTEYEADDLKVILLHSCHHTVCIDCLKGYLTSADDPKVKCPTENCIGIIEDGEISKILTAEEYAKYEQLNLRTAEARTTNTFHCKTPNCIAWVVYDDNVNFFDCTLCNKKNCILCAAVHENQTCQEYQDELVIRARNDEAAKKDLEFLENMIKKGEAMKCPGCKIIVQKKSGCDWMQCNMCKVEICWATKGPRWGPNGRGDTSGGCQCNYLLKRCTPTCGNCH